MENRKRRLSDIGRTSKVKVQKGEINSCVESLKIENDIEKCGAVNTHQTQYRLKADVFTKAVIRVENSEELESSLEYTDKEGGSFKGQRCLTDNSNHRLRVYARDDSGYQSDEVGESSLDSDDGVDIESNTPWPNKEEKIHELPLYSQLNSDNCCEPCSHCSSHDKKVVGEEKPTHTLENDLDGIKDNANDVNDDDESDVIIPNDKSETILKIQPKSIDKGCAWTKYSLSSPVENRLFEFGKLPDRNSLSDILFRRPDLEPCQKSNIYIPHKYADEPQGDTLGVQIWTYVIKQKDGTIYNQHFFVCVVTDGPADKMKIRDNDEIVLVNGTFVPQITHTDLLNLFHNVKVDGKTRLEIIVRRTAKANRGFKKEWEWIQTSAVLAPDMRKELDNFPVVEYGKVSSHVGDGDELKPCMKEYQVSGTQYFLDIRNGEVCVNIKFRTTADRTKRICKRARVKVCPKDPTIVHYFAALSNEHRTEYISLGHKDEIKLDDKPLWFEFKKSSDEIWFKTKELFLSCNRSTAKLMADHKKFLFKESSADEEGFDCPDGSSQMNAASSYFGTSSCCANTLTHGNNFFGVSGADVESTCCDMSELPSAEEVNGLENESKVNKPEQCPIKEPKRSEMTLNINGNMNSSSSPHEILKTPTTPFASLLIAN